MGVDDGGAGLKPHASVQAVHVHSGYLGHLSGVVGLAYDYGGEGHHLVAVQADLFGQTVALTTPECIVLLLEPLDDGLGTGSPVEFVGVGDEHADEGLGPETQGVDHGSVFQGGGECGGVGLEVAAEECCQAVEGLDIAPEGDLCRSLPAVGYHADDVLVRHAWLYDVAARLEVGG